MKKQYIAPATNIVAVETPEIICTSIDGFSLDDEETTGACYARGRYDIWDNMWDED